ncbi:MAG: biotin attachment protein [Desulfurococcales archaeon]|nr:biotin attachment protein [Desulfurococcales archaeon]
MPTSIIVPRELWPRRSDWTGTVIEVYKEEGDIVVEGDTLADIEIEKAVIAIDSPINGVVEKVYVTKGDKIGPDTVLMSIREE